MCLLTSPMAERRHMQVRCDELRLSAITKEMPSKKVLSEEKGLINLYVDF